MEPEQKYDAVERIHESAELRPVGEPEGGVWEAVLLEPGLSLNERYYSEEFIRAAAPAFENAPAYDAHEGPALSALVGRWTDLTAPREMRGNLRVLESETGYRQKLADAHKAGIPIPVSIAAVILFDKATRNGRPVLEARKLLTEYKGHRIQPSIDFVRTPGAGGRILRAVASAEDEDLLKAAREQFLRPNPTTTTAPSSEQKGAQMPEEKKTPAPDDTGAVTQVAESVKALEARVQEAETRQQAAESRLLLNEKVDSSKLAEPLAKLVRERFEGKLATAEEIDGEIKRVREAYAAMVPNPTRTGGSVVQVGYESIDKMEIALARSFGVTHEWKKVRELVNGHMITRHVRGAEIDRTIEPFPSVRKAYEEWTGDFEVTGEVHPDWVRRITEEWKSTTFPSALNNVANKRMLQDYNEVQYGILDLAQPASVSNFKTQEANRIGYLPDLSDNDPEDNDWPEIAAPTDDKIQFSLGQKGNTLTVTRKMIINDDTGAILVRRISRLARAAKRTKAQAVTSKLEANAAIYDAVAWFHADHSNLGTTALAAAEFAVVRGKFHGGWTEKDSLKKLMFEGPFWLLIPPGLETAAKKANRQEHLSNDLSDVNTARFMFGQNDERIIINPLFADATDWAVAGNPAEAPYMEIAYLNGRSEPDLVIQDNPSVGKVFTGDRITLRIRDEYVVYAVDFRNIYWEEVA